MSIPALIAWLIVLAGVVHLVLAFHTHSAGGVVWKLLVGVGYLLFGIYLLMHRVLGVVSLTLVLASLFVVEGILDVVLFFKMRHMRGAGWVIFDGIVTLLLGLMIYIGWPSSSRWAIGTLVGVSMIISGISRIMISLAIREVVAQVA